MPHHETALKLERFFDALLSENKLYKLLFWIVHDVNKSIIGNKRPFAIVASTVVVVSNIIVEHEYSSFER